MVTNLYIDMCFGFIGRGNRAVRLAIFAPFPTIVTKARSNPSWLPLAFVKNDTTMGGKTDVNRVTWVQRTDHLSIDGPKQS